MTVKFSAGTETEHGVLQPGPTEVIASAPDGIESICTEHNTFGYEPLAATSRLAFLNTSAIIRAVNTPVLVFWRLG